MTTRVSSGGFRTSKRALATVGLVAAACVTLLSASARADSMDPTPERFVTQPSGLPAGKTCQQIAANPTLLGKGYNYNSLNQLACLPNNLAFQNLVSELGFAIAPTAFHPARTTGFGGFAFSIEASYTKINPDASAGGLQYWHLGTQGSVDPTTGLQSTQNLSPDSLIQVYTLKGRKGFPLGFEITGDLGYIANTVMWTAGADIRWALMEGFRTGWPAYLPDLSVGGGVRTLSGTSKFSLTSVGIDAQISKPIPLADLSTLTPYVGYQRLYIFGDSSTVDLTPNVDATKACGPKTTTQADGEPVCTNHIGNTGYPNSFDYNNFATFSSVRTDRHRGILGVNYRHEVLYLATQFLIDLTSPDAENPGLTPTRQWTLSFEAGVYF